MTVPKLTRRGFLAAGALALAVSPRALARLPTGGAGEVTHVARDERIDATRLLAGGPRELPARGAPRHTLLGLHWRGEGRLWARSGTGEAWSHWVHVVEEGAPDTGTSEDRATRGWRLGIPIITGAADRVQFRVEGNVSALRAHYLWSEARALRRVALLEAPAYVPRGFWGADESIVRAPPYYADRLLFSVVHHTAGRAPLAPEESAAIVRAIQSYHVKGNGWNDIGYNALVDPFGQVFEGRVGGLDRNVVGAHVRGFNTGSFGVAVLGNSEIVPFSPEAHDAIVRLLAWRLDLAHVDPSLPLPFTTSGNERYSPGASVTIPAVCGHRDLGLTSCPGTNVYSTIFTVGQEIYSFGLPKLFEPRIEGEVGGPLRFTARLSEERDWVVRVTDPQGAVVAEGTGRGSSVDWSWDATGATADAYAYTIEAGEGLRPASGTLDRGAAQEAAQATPPSLPPRPSGLPKRIPRWAWRLHRWQSTPSGQRGDRPSAPTRPPAWYWRWRRWRLGLERARR